MGSTGAMRPWATPGLLSTPVGLPTAMRVGMVPLTGTTSEQHMREDLGVYEIELTDDEVNLIESIAG